MTAFYSSCSLSELQQLLQKLFLIAVTYSSRRLESDPEVSLTFCQRSRLERIGVLFSKSALQLVYLCIPTGHLHLLRNVRQHGAIPGLWRSPQDISNLLSVKRSPILLVLGLVVSTPILYWLYKCVCGLRTCLLLRGKWDHEHYQLISWEGLAQG